MSKKYNYYIATARRWTIVPADHAREALDLGENHKDLEGSKPVLVVRIATPSEVELLKYHHDMVCHEEQHRKNIQDKK